MCHALQFSRSAHNNDFSKDYIDELKAGISGVILPRPYLYRSRSRLEIGNWKLGKILTKACHCEEYQRRSKLIQAEKDKIASRLISFYLLPNN